MQTYPFQSIIFDLDGVVTKTALVHAKAWKEGFDEYLRMRVSRDNEPFKEFTHEHDYLPFVDGKPRYEGVKSFLESRNIHIPYGEPSDPPDKETVCGIGNKKNAKFLQILERDGAQMYPSTVALIKELRRAGIKVGVASSSKNCQAVLQSAGIEELFLTRVDGKVSAQLGLKGKPEGDIFVRATLNLGVMPAKSIVVEDATSGVAAGRNGGFGFVLGIARENNEKDLLQFGADAVVKDIAPITLAWLTDWFKRTPRGLFESWEVTAPAQEVKLVDEKHIIINPHFERGARNLFAGQKKPVFFLDYDGTLTPIVSRPELARISDEMQNTVQKLSKKFAVVIVSGRMREDVQKLAKIEGIVYAGSHGFDISGPNVKMIQPEAEKIIPTINAIIEKLKKEVGQYEGVLIEEKKFSVAVHYRLAKDEDFGQIKKAVDALVAGHTEVRCMHGKKVFEILPAIDWDKGKAVRWVMQALGIGWQDSSIVYIGDDTTDEDAFRMVRTRGSGILVAKDTQPSAADFILTSPDEVLKLFNKILSS